MLIINNCRAIIPQIDDIERSVPANGSLFNYPAIYSRGSSEFTHYVTNLITIGIPWKILCSEMLEVYLDGIRVINQSYDFGRTRIAEAPLTYVIENQTIVFDRPVVGEIKVIFDNQMDPYVPEENIIKIDNIFGGEYAAFNERETYAATWCEPVICTQPYNGFVRMSDDRKSMIYVPEVGFVGNDSFSYTVKTVRGQIAETKCVYITVHEYIPPEQ